MGIEYRTAEDVLDDIDQIFSKLIDEHDLDNNLLERWRWGEQSTRLSWTEEDGIGRNIKALLRPDDDLRVEVQVNAWKDLDREKTEMEVNSDLPEDFELRLWRHETIEVAAADPEELQNIIHEDAFPFVQELDQDELTRQKVLE
ncbi:hypothetical protein C453_01110 [Haloferax elongans ATCC BAA-1513]|uniref:Uncharacterized protein n=1 Tax=Haloferax elongans ATCC BAA-1513 TaxID=1230453 RepID=M0I0A4_HALEO|nr:hypothetical protein [Haloferax elongans]ELZ88819.1 hypothetical protein C453_01110 [Haloferax elongans ATCC BAA-1513]